MCRLATNNNQGVAGQLFLQPTDNVLAVQVGIHEQVEIFPKSKNKKILKSGFYVTIVEMQMLLIDIQAEILFELLQSFFLVFRIIHLKLETFWIVSTTFEYELPL